MAPTVSSYVNDGNVHVFGPTAVIVPVFVQLDDHPPNLAPVAGAVKITVDP
jgi:hypothetical protein